MDALPGVAFGTALVCLDWERALALVVLISPLALIGRMNAEYMYACICCVKRFCCGFDGGKLWGFSCAVLGIGKGCA